MKQLLQPAACCRLLKPEPATESAVAARQPVCLVRQTRTDTPLTLEVRTCIAQEAFAGTQPGGHRH